MFQTWLCLVLLTLRVNSVDRIVPILHAHHYFHMIEDHGMGAYELESSKKRRDKNLIPRPPSLVGFFREECRDDFIALDFVMAERDLPPRYSLFAGWYDVNAQFEHTWWKFEFDMDLAAHLDVEQCVELVFIPPGYDVFKNSPNIYEDWPSFPDSTLERWHLPNTRKQTWKSSWRKWFWNLLETQVAIMNTKNEAISVVLDHPGTKAGSQKGTIKPGETAIYTTSALKIMTVAGEKYIIPYTERSSPLFVAGARSRGNLFYTLTEAERRDKVTKSRDQFTTFTESSNVFIPPVIPRLTDNGYFLIDMPKSLHRKMLDFWEDYKHKGRRETFADSYTIINWFHSDPNMVSLSLNSRRKNNIAIEEVKHLIAKWAKWPEEDLVLTSFYGMREYHSGNYLRNHVDRSSTHVLSVILQVAQIGVNASWPVEIIGYKGDRLRINMEAGQMLFYESAKVIHGRPEVLQGEGFINAFCHYKPKSGWNYHSKNDEVWNGDEFLADTKLRRLRDNLLRGRSRSWF